MSSKNWKEVERLSKVKDRLAKEIEELALALCAKHKEILECNLEQFSSAPNVDTMLECSPIAPTKLKNDFRVHLLKIGCPWEKRWMDEDGKLPSFSETIKLGNKWVMKLKNKEV